MALNRAMVLWVLATMACDERGPAGPNPNGASNKSDACPGGWPLAQAIAAGVYPRRLALSDLDGDGDLDIGLSLGGENAVRTFRNDGAGDFSPWERMDGKWVTNGIAFGDVDADGDADAVIGMGDQPTFNLEYFNDGSGSFLFGDYLRERFPDGPSEEPVLVDLNADGLVDLVTWGNIFNDDVEVRINDVNGLQDPKYYRFGGDVRDFQVMDVDQDGRLDLLGVGWFDPVLTWIPGDGQGSFGSPSRTETGLLNDALAVGDFDADGISDVAVSGRPAETPDDIDAIATVIMKGDGRGAFEPQPRIDPAGWIEPIDANYDKWDDLVLAAFGKLSVLLGGSNVEIPLEGGVGPTAIAVGELDGKPGPDLATVDNFDGKLRIYLCSPDG